MKRQILAAGACALMLAAASSAMTQSRPSAADPYPACTAQCRTVEATNLRSCSASTGPNLERCRSRVGQTTGQCLNRCTADENRRLNQLNARAREAQSRARSRGQ